MGLLFSIRKSRVPPHLRSELFIANNVRDARRCVQSHTSELVHKRKDVKNSSQMVCSAHGGVCKGTPPN